MDLTFPPAVERAARTAREFVAVHLLPAAESNRLGLDRRGALSDLAPVVATSSLAHFAVFQELGRVPAPWAETFRAAGLQFHDVARAGVTAEEAGLVGLALGDPRRRADPDALGVRATTSGTRAEQWELHGVAQVPGYLAPVDSLLIGAAVPGPSLEVGLFLTKPPLPVLARHDVDLLHVALDGTSAHLIARGEAAGQHLLALRRRERLSQIALALGAASRAHESSLAAAREATAARDPLALGQGIQFQVADDAIDLQVAETLALHAAALAETGALTDADLASTRFMVLDAFERIALRAAHITGLFWTSGGATAGPTVDPARFCLELALRLKVAGGAVELDRREAALGLLQSA